MTETKPKEGRLAGVEGLRAIAALSILTWHVYIFSQPERTEHSFGWASTNLIPQLQLGVWTFFCLSAFLLYRPFAAAIIGGRPLPSVRRYARSRVLRIVPAYWFVLTFITFVLSIAIVRAGDGRLGIHLPTYLADLLFVQSYHPSGVLTGIGPAWSLCVEVVFYALLPAFALMALWLSRRIPPGRGATLAALSPALVLLVVGVVGKEIGRRYLATPDDPTGFGVSWFAVWERSFLAQCDLFAFGIVLAVMRVLQERGELSLPRGWRPAALAAAVVVSVVAIPLSVDGDLRYDHFSTIMAGVNGLLVGLVVLVPAALAGRDALCRALDRRPIRWLGEISYSVFLWHYPLVFFLAVHGFTLNSPGGLFVNWVLVLVLTLALSSLTYRYVERPFLARRRDAAPAVQPAAAQAAP